jgi:DNA polymerase-3 subunit delta'
MARAPSLLETETFPEVDRLEDFPHPRETVRLFGHQLAEGLLAETLASGRIHHAWLLAGLEGIGKATLAYRFAAHALASPLERDPAAKTLSVPERSAARRQVAALAHPSLLVIRRAFDPKNKRIPASIPVDEVRRLRAFVSHTAIAESWRVVIVDQADELNPNSANALLKSLEEPPPRTIMLLVTSQPGLLLPTLRSRCRILKVSPLGREPLREAALQAFGRSDHEPPAEEQWSRLVELSAGSVRHLLSLAASGGLKLDQSVQRIMSSLPSVDWGAAHALSDELSSPAAHQRFETFWSLLLGAVAARARSGSRAAWAEVWETLTRARQDADLLNLDRKSLILDALDRLAAAARA